MGSNSSSRMDDSDSTSRSDHGLSQETDLATILHHLIRSGQVQIISSYEEDIYEPYKPKIKHKPNTSKLNKSEFFLETRLAAGSCPSNKHKVSRNDVASMLINRERGLNVYQNFSSQDRCNIANRFLPNKMNTLFRSGTKVFCGTYSANGEYFISACQDGQIRVYYTGDGGFKLFNTVQARDMGWSVIDVVFSPDCKYFVYSSWSSSLHLCRLDDSDNQERLFLSPIDRRFSIFSCVFSSDGKDILGGANDGCLYVYDMEKNQRSLRIPAHGYDVNTVAFADSTSQILYSGGDDGLVQVWDRRTLSEANPQPVGYLAGHVEGITYIDSRGDGRHLISNSKDQTIKLWDIRVFSDSKPQSNTVKVVQDQTWDYRWQEVPRKLYKNKQKLEGDTSIMTYRGHSVLKTLIRCRFSPAVTTGQKYIYTGCSVGQILIYDALTGEIKRSLSKHNACVRDVSWHPYRNEIVSSSWDCTIGHWKFFSKDLLDSNENETDDSVFGDDARRRPKTLRRSRRIAQKRERQQEQEQ